MARPVFSPVFEEAESVILARVVGRISDEWRKEPGDYIYDAVAPGPLEVKQLQINQDSILKSGAAMYAEGPAMDRKLAEVGLTRIAATYNTRTLNVTADAGVVVPLGYTASVVVLDDNGNPLNYNVETSLIFAAAGTLVPAITCKTAGTVGNVVNGSEFILSPAIPGVRIVADNGTVTLARDTETDEEAYVRYLEKINNPDTGGNRNDYVRWAKETEGVGAAKCIPLWNGNGTVRVLIVDASMLPAGAPLVLAVQTDIDPGSTGLGDGRAPCGAKVTVVAATSVPVTIAATSVTWDPEANVSEGEAAFTAAVQVYLTSLVFNVAGSQVVYVKILGLLSTTPGVINFAGLTVNAGTADVAVGAEAVATLGTVSL